MGTKSKAKGKAARKAPTKRDAAEAASSTRIAVAKPVGDGQGGKGSKEGKGGKGAAPPPDVPGEEDGEGGEGRPKRALGLRGAAPWAARHAAKHAAEARKRAAEPPPPGSARATIRTPSGVEEIKAHIADLHNNLERIKSMRKNLPKTFFDIGVILRDIQTQKLFAAKGFQSFESFVEREVDLGKTVVMRLVKLVSIFQREAALELGMDRAIEALVHLEGGPEAQQPGSDSRLPAAKPPNPSSASKGPIVGR